MNYLEGLRTVPINISNSGDNVIIGPGVSGSDMPASWENAATYIVIDFISFIPSASVTIQFKNGATNLGGPLPLVAGQPLTWENAIHNEHGVLTLSPNSNFIINLSGPVQVGGIIRYRLLAQN